MAKPSKSGSALPAMAQTAARSFVLHVALPIATLTIAASLLLVGAVWWAAREQDRFSVRASQQVLRGAIDNRLEFLADEVADDAVWSEAFEQMRSGAHPALPPPEIAAQINGTSGVDASFVIGPDDKVLYATRSGTAALTAVGLGAPYGLLELVRSVRASEASPPLTRLVMLEGRPALASAAEVRHADDQGDGGRATLLLFVDVLDQKLLAQFGRDFGLTGLHWRNATDPVTAPSLRLDGGGDAALGTLTWSLELPGSTMLRQTAPAVASVILAFALVTAFVLARARRTAILLHVAQAQATHDALTGLPNRLLLMDRLEQALATSRRELGQVGVLYLDLDGFKAINDRFGHAHGDAVLVEVALRLRRVARETDTVARLAGDEFAVVQTGGAQPLAAQAMCRRVLRTLGTPMTIGGQPVQLGASIGIAIGPDHADDPARLLHLADQALYRAKNSGRGMFMLHRDAQDDDPVALLPQRAMGWSAMGKARR